MGIQPQVHGFGFSILLDSLLLPPRPNDLPTSPMSNCNKYQCIALFLVLPPSTFFSFFSSFVNCFIYDAASIQLVYLHPNFKVTRHVLDLARGCSSLATLRRGGIAGRSSASQTILSVIVRADCVLCSSTKGCGFKSRRGNGSEKSRASASTG
jgi:hypothetical protein